MMEFDEIMVKESPGLCRCCLSEGCYKDLASEYTWMNETEIYAEMLLECFDISISQHNDGPNGPNRLICEVCITRLRDACNFKKQVTDSEKKFVDMIGRGEFGQKVVIYQTMKAEVMGEEAQTEEGEVEYLDEEMQFDDTDDQPLRPPTDDVPEPSGSETITIATHKVKGKRGRPKKTAMKPEKKVKVAKIEPKTSKVAKDEYPPGPYDGYTSERRRKNLQILFNNTTIIPFKWRGRYLCFYCGKNYALYPDFRKHTKSHGLCSTKDYSLKIIKGNHIEIKIDVSEIVCDICNEPFDTFNDIVDHLIVKHCMEYDKSIDIPLQEYRLADCRCLFCDQNFTYFGNLISHVNISHPQNCFICDDCGITFNKKRDLVTHLRTFHRKGGYPCDQCSKVFESGRVLRTHQNNYHFRKCRNCSLTFVSYTLLQKHIQVDHPDDGCLKCSYCNKECHSKQGLKQHQNRCKVKLVAQGEPVDSTPALFSSECIEPKKKQNVQQIRANILSVLNMSTAVPFKFFAKYFCFYCSKKFVDFEELKAHTLLEHPIYDLKSKCIKKCKGERTCVKIDISSLNCKLCGEPIDDLDVLIDHLITTHNANYDKSITGCLEPFRIIKDNIPCPICSQVFRYFSILLRHINSEHSDNNSICDFCGRSFKNVANLNVHISYAHTGSVQCDVCLSKFKNQWCLSRHKAKSHDAKDFKCPKCPEMFQSQYHKQKHLIKIHDVGHKCSFCGRMFTRNSFMKDHIRRTHLKERNVPCSVCNEKFFDNYLLKMHMVKHEGDRKFTCTVCGKAFLRRSNLYSHMEMHKKYGHVQLAI